MGPIEFIVAAAKGAAKFAGKHAVLTAAAVTTAVGGGYVAYDNYKGAERAADGTVVKRDVAVNDKDGDLRMKMQGVGKEAAAPKANEPTKSDAKPGNDGALKKLQDASKDADIKAEAAKAVEQPELPTEKPYIPETAAAEAVDASANVLDGNDSAAFKPARFASSVGGSGSNAGKTAAKPGSGSGTKSVSGTGASAQSATTAGSGVKSASPTSETASSGKTEIAKTGGDKGGESDNQGGLKTETKDVLSSDNKSASDGNGETANSPSDGGETLSAKTTTVMPTTTVEDTVSTVAAPTPKTSNPSFETLSSEKKTVFGSRGSSNSDKAAAQKKREEDVEKERLRKEYQYLRDLEEAFEKETDVNVDDVVASSDRKRSGITSHEVMRLAAHPDMRAKKVTLYVDNDATTSDLITLLTELGAKSESERNSNLSFLLRNGTKFLDAKDTIPGIALYPDKSGRVAVYFDNAPVAPSDKKKPDAGKPTDTTKKATKPASGVPAGGSTPTTTGTATGGSKTVK